MLGHRAGLSGREDVACVPGCPGRSNHPSRQLRGHRRRRWLDRRNSRHCACGWHHRHHPTPCRRGNCAQSRRGRCTWRSPSLHRRRLYADPRLARGAQHPRSPIPKLRVRRAPISPGSATLSPALRNSNTRIVMIEWRDQSASISSTPTARLIVATSSCSTTGLTAVSSSTRTRNSPSAWRKKDTSWSLRRQLRSIISTTGRWPSMSGASSGSACGRCG